MSQRVARDPLREAGPSGRRPHCLLNHGLVEMMAAPLSRRRVAIHPRGGKDPLPRPRAARIRGLDAERVRQLDPAGAEFEVGQVLAAYRSQVRTQSPRKVRRQNRAAVLVTLTLPDRHLASTEIQILHPKAQPFEQAQAAAVKQAGHQRRRVLDMSQQEGHLVHAQDRGDPPSTASADHVGLLGPTTHVADADRSSKSFEKRLRARGAVAANKPVLRHGFMGASAWIEQVDEHGIPEGGLQPVSRMGLSWPEADLSRRFV